MKNTRTRRLLTLLLTLALLLTLTPTARLSPNEGGDGTGTGTETTNPGEGDSEGGGEGDNEGDNEGGGENPDPNPDPNPNPNPDPNPNPNPNPDEGEGDGDEEDPPPAVTGIEIGGDDFGLLVQVGDEPNKEYNLTLEQNTGGRGSVRLSIDVQPANVEENRQRHVFWESGDASVVSAQEASDQQHPGQGHIGVIRANAPGKTDVTVTVEDHPEFSITIHVEVSGVKLSDELAEGITISENERKTLTEGRDYFLYGRAADKDATLTVTAQTGQRNVMTPDGKTTQKDSFTIEGRMKGKSRLQMKVELGKSYSYASEFTVNVEATELVIPYTAGVSPEKPLKFSELESLLNQHCREQTGSDLVSVIDLKVPTNEGMLYLNYKSPEDTGAGVGSSVTYYAKGKSTRGPYLSDITFVPRSTYKGEKATISFTGQSKGSDNQPRTFKGRIEVTLTDEKADLTVTTRRETPLRFTESLFTKACQNQVGSPLSYVIFTLPPASQGTLYVDYKSAQDYATKVSANTQYSRTKLDTITFVPAPGFVGEVRVRYAGYSVSGTKYTGELIIQVQQGLDDAITYNDNGSGSVTFSGSDFNDFCYNATGRELGDISFTLPPASQGVLYANWNGNRGGEAVADKGYSYTELNRMTFVAANGFDGIVRIPFSGRYRNSSNSEDFKGTVEVHIQTSGVHRGDISYICAAGQSVKLDASDFSGWCESITGQRLHYIQFQTLPDFNQGALFHNRTSSGGMGTRVTTSTKYYLSATPYLSNLSFWATQNFRGAVDIPFTGAAVNGQTFTGIMTISSGDGAGSGSSATISYMVYGQNPARLAASDFDEACRQATNEALNYIVLTLPSSGQGILYYDYAATNTSPKTVTAGTSLYQNGENRIDRVSFVPAKNYVGAVTLPYSGYSIKGQLFQGLVQITVQSAGAMGGLVRYETTGAPVHINAYHIQEAAGGVPVSLQLTGLPTASQGKLYYNYVSPTNFSWQGNTTTEYSMYGDPSVSNLTFVPRAGYYGEVNIPYTARRQDGPAYNGTIRITVTEPSASANFNDLGGYSSQTKSAVDYLFAQGVINGVGEGKYEPGASIRRGDFCLMLARAFQFNVGSTATGFTDVAGDAYYAQAVNQLYALGIVNGVGGGRFNPSAPVSRQDAALMVQRTLQQAGISAPDGNAAALAAYDDRGEVSGYAQGAVGGLAQQGLLPLSGGKLVPKANLTRADMAVLLHRSMTK